MKRPTVRVARAAVATSLPCAAAVVLPASAAAAGELRDVGDQARLWDLGTIDDHGDRGPVSIDH